MEIVESKNFDLIAELTKEVQNLHAQLFPTVYKPFEKEKIGEVMKKLMADEQCRVFIAQAGGKTIGYMIVMIKDIPENGFHYGYKLLHIDQIVVSPSHRHSGVGSVLMNKAEALAEELQISTIELDHLFVNETAAKFFRNRGFDPYRQKLHKTIDIQSS